MLYAKSKSLSRFEKKTLQNLIKNMKQQELVDTLSRRYEIKRSGSIDNKFDILIKKLREELNQFKNIILGLHVSELPEFEFQYQVNEYQSRLSEGMEYMKILENLNESYREDMERISKLKRKLERITLRHNMDNEEPDTKRVRIM